MRLLDQVDKFMETPHCKRHPRRNDAYYPSSASCKYTNEYGEETIAGKCMRSGYYSMTGVKKSNPMTARSLRICSVGKLVEQHEVETYKKMGIWRDNNVKFYNKETNISGEIDAIVADVKAKKNIGVEIKTGYDYYFRREVLGNTYRAGTPKINNLLQTMIYVDYFKMLFKLVYIDRGNAARGEFDITLSEDGCPVVNKKAWKNGISMPNILARFNALGEYLESDTLPPREFALQYTKERLKTLYDSKRLNKKETEEFSKNKDITKGDWECSYCDYKDHCWKDGGK